MSGTLHRFISESPDPIAVLDESGRVVVTNEGWRLLGGPLEGTHIDSWAPLAGAFEVAQRDGWARVHGGGGPAEVGIDGVLARIDVEDHGRFVVRARLSSEAPAHAHNRFFALIENFPFAIVVHRNYRYVYLNRAAVEYLGYSSASELIGQPFTRVIAPDETDVIRARSDQVAMTGEPVPERETRIIRKDGVVIVAETAQFEIRDADGLASYVVVARDVTERRTLEQRLQQGQRLEAIGRLVGGVAHDFNNILAVIMSQAEWLQSAAGRADPANALTEILSATRRARALTAQLLTFTGSGAQTQGADAAHRSLTRAGHAVAEIASFLRSALGPDASLVLDVPSDEDAFMVGISASQIEQIVTNLVVNARDALPDGGTVSVSLRRVDTEAAPTGELPRELPPGAYVELAVADDGTGMPDEVRARAFEPFFTTKPVGKGTGLGLSTVYGIVRHAGGVVEIMPRHPKGTTVRAYLPAGSPPTRAPSATPEPAAAAVPAPARRIMLVEDDDAVRMVLGRLLRQRGYEVDEATGPDEAVAIAERGGPAPELLVTDVLMPQLSGPQLADRMRERYVDLPVLFVSGYSDDVLDAAHLGGERVAFLAKPFSTTELFEAVERLTAPRPAKR